MKQFDENAEEKIINVYGADISVYSDGSIWIHRGSKNKRRYGNTTYKGYKSTIIRDDGRERLVFVHRLVALAFIPNPNRLPQINHINGIRDDNRPENLEWCTNKQNTRHRIDILKHFGKSKPVVCVETGECFQSIKQASVNKRISRANIQSCLGGRRKSAGGFHWKLKEGDSD